MRSADSFPSLKLHDDTSFEFFWAWGNLSMQWGAAQATPHLIASMSFRLVIPGWVALQQSPLALRQPSRSCQNRRLIERGSSVISPSSTRLLQTVKDVPAQNVKDVSALDTILARWGGPGGATQSNHHIHLGTARFHRDVVMKPLIMTQPHAAQNLSLYHAGGPHRTQPAQLH